MKVDQYFDGISEDRIKQMEGLRKLIKDIFPDVTEDMSYKLPTYTYNGLKICAIASQKHYMALYIMYYDLLKHFEEELQVFNCGKSCIRFKKLDNNSQVLFQKILIYIKNNIQKSEFYKS